MALLPLHLRPKHVLRRQAMRRGVFGPSLAWKAIAVVVYGGGTMRRVFGKQPELLGRRVLRPGQVMIIAASKPMSRRQRKRSGITKSFLAARARADLEAAQRAS